MSHSIWDDSGRPDAPPWECQDCGLIVVVGVEFRRNERHTFICFDCIRDAMRDIEEHKGPDA